MLHGLGEEVSNREIYIRMNWVMFAGADNVLGYVLLPKRINQCCGFVSIGGVRCSAVMLLRLLSSLEAIELLSSSSSSELLSA